MRELRYSDPTIRAMKQEAERQAVAVNVERSRAALAADTALSPELLARIGGGGS